VSALAERLRGIVRPAAASGGLPPGTFTSGASGPEEGDSQTTSPGARPTSDDAGSAFRRKPADPADVLDGEWRELRGQRFLVVDRKYLPGHRHGRVSVADTLPPDDAWWPRFPLLDNNRTTATGSGRMLFVDLETTGLAGGAGTYAFLVGCAWYEAGCLRVRQFFLANFGAERVLLEAVAATADICGAVVTYNGKSFDLPLIDTRFQLHRLETPFAGMPHVDMLHPARRLWRRDEADAREGGARLSTLEQNLCGHVREGDVPGFEIPSRYFQFVRTGDARGMEAVLEHNRLDLVSLAMLTARASQLLEDGPAAAHTAREALGMGRLYERAGMSDDARAAYARSAECGDADSATRAEAWRAYAVLSRRERRFDEAATAWRRILNLRRCPEAVLREASEALAVHHEHRVRDLNAARTFALQLLTLQSTRSRHEATQHRLARLDRKLSDASAVTAALF
jgi:uncharacterized protein